MKDKIAGVCDYCSNAYGVIEEVKNSGVTLTDAFEGHPSFKDLVDKGYQVITF